MQTTSSSISLESVLDEFSHWRTHKLHTRERIPDRLWLKAVRLSPHYSQREICQTLGLNTSAFSEQQQKYRKPTTVESSFVEVQMQVAQTTTVEASLILEYERIDGCKMCVLGASAGNHKTLPHQSQ